LDLNMPPSLEKIKSDIANALATAGIKLNFNITNYREETSEVEYSLTSTLLPLECTVTQAKEIADAHIKKWKKASYKNQ
jgi:hypothetical protein